MIYITGDIHGSIDIGKLSNARWPEGKTLTKDDYLIILGDFGLPFLESELYEHGRYHGEYKYWMNWLSEKPYTILWIDGNHEYFGFWEKQPVTKWHGGNVQIHPHASNVIHLMRGEVYEIEGKKFFTFGGAVSIDKECRTEGITWWRQEEASPKDIKNAEEHLVSNSNKVDYILTHTMPTPIIKDMYGPNAFPDTTADYLESIASTVQYDKWFCGHFHEEKEIPEYKLQILYKNIIKL